MKLEIWNETSAEPEKVVRLRLVPDGTGGVSMAVVDDTGSVMQNGFLLHLNAGGVRRYATFPAGYGFATRDGRVVEKGP